MNIIQQSLEIITKEYYENLESLVKNHENISDFILKTDKMLKNIGTMLVKNKLEEVDQCVKCSRERKKNWNVERSRDEKTLSTIFGDVTYKRTYYKNNKTYEYAYLSDETLGIMAHERMDDSLRAELVDKAANLSYEKTINNFDNVGIHSRTAVMKAIRKVEAIRNDAVPLKFRKQKVRVLYVEVDEDHLAIQRGKGKMAPIVYVHEGIEKISKNRNKLKNVRYFTGVKTKSEDLWLEVADYIEEAYDTDAMEKIYLSGDGASWIKEGLNWLPKSYFVLDRFHLAKYVKRATAHIPEMHGKMWECIDKNNKKDAKKLFDKIMKSTEKESKRKSVAESRTYIIGNWDAIQRQYMEDYVGCSAEGHVSHMLSDRLSSRPMGWSIEGADEMARLRAFKFNGGNVYEYIVNKRKADEKTKRIQKLDTRIIKNSKNDSYEKLNNITVINFGKKNWASSLLKSIRAV